jgi:hypothetical protein
MTLIKWMCRTGQDRTGQDRTGQDRTGQDRTGQDRTGQDRMLEAVIVLMTHDCKCVVFLFLLVLPEVTSCRWLLFPTCRAV